MIVLLGLELAISVAGTMAFLLLYGNPNRRDDPVMAWHVALFSGATGLETLALLGLAVGVAVPIALFALIFAAIDRVVLWRLALLVQARRPKWPDRD